MLANNVRQETISTGLGAITLGAVVDNGRAFSSRFAVNERCSYFIDDRAGNFETGIGYLSDSTTLVRETFLDGSASTFVSFAAGTKQVYVAASAQTQGPIRTGYLNADGAKPYLSGMYDYGSVSNRTLSAGWVYLLPYCLLTDVVISGLGVDVISLAAAAGELTELGLYVTDYSLNTYRQVARTGVIDLSATGATGINTASFLGGDYEFNSSEPHFIAFGGNGNGTIAGRNHSIGGHPFMPQSSYKDAIGMYYQTGFSSAGNVLPAALGAAGASATQATGVYPTLFGVKA